MKKIARTILASLVVWMGGGAGLPLSLAAAPAYEADQIIDEELGLLKRPWNFDLIRFHSVWNQPAQVQQGVLPPFDQETEKAQRFGPPVGTCVQVQQGTVCKSSPLLL